MNLKGRICPAYWWFIIIFELFFLWQKNCKFISGWGCKHKYRQKTCPSEIGSHLLQYPSFVCWSRFQVRATTIAMWWNNFWSSIQNTNSIKYFITGIPWFSLFYPVCRCSVWTTIDLKTKIDEILIRISIFYSTWVAQGRHRRGTHAQVR